MHIYWTKITKIVNENSEVKTYFLEVPEGFTWIEGSHTHFALKGFNEGEKPNRGLVRHMSISTLPEEGAIGITTRFRPPYSEFKATLDQLEVGSEVALFKTHSNVPLRREHTSIYLLSSGVGLATFRPILLEYMKRPDSVKGIYSLNIDSSGEYLFTELFASNPAKNVTATFVDRRKDYYDEVENLAQDSEGIFYIVGGDDFIRENIEVLRRFGIRREQMMLDKRERQLPMFFGEVPVV